jgi:hypothetical protein
MRHTNGAQSLMRDVRRQPTMVVVINGSFGIGKTTVAELLSSQLVQSTVFNPEPLGLAIATLAKVVPLKHRTVDFQDLMLWRRATVRSIRALTRIRRTVIVPMAFSNAAYLNEMVTPLRRCGIHTGHFCLTAPIQVVLQRLQVREGHRGPSAWQLRRSEECCVAHQGSEFAEHVPAAERSAADLARYLAERIRTTCENPPAAPVA